MPKTPVAIEALLPHRPSMLLITEVLYFDERKAKTRSVVTEKWPLLDEQGANALVLVELVAQTAGINNGWEILQRQGPGADHRGWIVGIKASRFYTDNIPLGTDIVVESVNQFEYDNFREIHGVAKIEGRIAAEVTLQLVQAQNDS